MRIIKIVKGTLRSTCGDVVNVELRPRNPTPSCSSGAGCHNLGKCPARTPRSIRNGRIPSTPSDSESCCSRSIFVEIIINGGSNRVSPKNFTAYAYIVSIQLVGPGRHSLHDPVKYMRKSFSPCALNSKVSQQDFRPILLQGSWHFFHTTRKHSRDDLHERVV